MPNPDRPPDEVYQTEHRCDLCADPDVTEMWVTRFKHDIVWHGSALTEKGEWKATGFDKENEWGVCDPCRQFLDGFSSREAEAFVDRLQLHYGLGLRPDVRTMMHQKVLGLAVMLSVETHDPWDLRRVPEGEATHRVWRND